MGGGYLRLLFVRYICVSGPAEWALAPVAAGSTRQWRSLHWKTCSEMAEDDRSFRKSFHVGVLLTTPPGCADAQTPQGIWRSLQSTRFFGDVAGWPISPRASYQCVYAHQESSPQPRKCHYLLQRGAGGLRMTGGTARRDTCARPDSGRFPPPSAHFGICRIL